MASPISSRAERNAGLLLMAAAAGALIIANSPLADSYQAALHARLGPLSTRHWIADGLMAIFFLLVGLEVKREWFDGQLASAQARRLPLLAAVSGMAVPALVFLAATRFDPTLSTGWAIPAATDIAFALGLLALLGNRVPASIKLLLVTIAVIDDIGAVAIIAFFYTSGLNFAALGAGAVIVAGLLAMNRWGVRRLEPYVVGFVALWIAVYQSGVHATIAGVVTALTIPLGIGEGHSPLKQLEHAIHPWVMFGVVPLFGFASAGVAIGGIAEMARSLPLGVALGLLIGKQLGVFGAIWLADRAGLVRKPESLSWPMLYGAALLCGVGFTMSLFIGELAFSVPQLIDEAKVGTLLGSALAGLLGFVVLRCVTPDRVNRTR